MMPFINDTSRRSVFQQSVQDMNVAAPSFGEVFGASVGLTIDEDLSISSVLNREGWQNRRELIRSKINEGVIDSAPYTNTRGRFNYNRAARDLNDPAIKTDTVLEEERRAMLDGRRKYAKDVIERGNGIAQFLGMANAFMLDPINIATMPIALPSTAAKSLSIAGRALLTARNAAAIGAASELAIQPLVYAHKHDIESPYSYKDALVAIGGAAIGAGVIGGVAGGVSGYLRKVRARVEEVGVSSPDVDFAMENLSRLESVLKSNPNKLDVGLEKSKILLELKAELLGDAQAKLSRGEVKSLKIERQELQTRLGKVVEESPSIKKEKGKPARQAKKEAIDAAKIKTGIERQVFQEKIDIIDQKISVSESAAKAESDLSRVDAGIIPDRFKARFDKVLTEEAVRLDIDYLEALEVQRDISGRPTVEAEHYAEAPRQKAENARASSREAAVLDDQGLTDDFNHDMRKFNELDSPKIIIDGESVDANVAMKEINDELEGIESVLSCAYGKL